MIELSLKSSVPEKQGATCLIMGVYEGRQWSEAVSRLDAQSNRALQGLIQDLSFEGKLGQALWMPFTVQNAGQSVLLVGCGPQASFSAKIYRQVLSKAATEIQTLGIRQSICFLTDLPIPEFDVAWKVYQAALLLLDNSYEFTDFKSTPKSEKGKKTKSVVKQCILNVAQRRDLSVAETALEQAQTVFQGMSLTKNLINTPPNVCTPTYLGEQALRLGKENKKLNVAVLNEKEIKGLKMGAFLAVAQASEEPPRFITLEYRGGKPKDKPIVFVGKGVTVDTGGICVKPAANIVGMKYDMSGAATVMGILSIAAKMGLPLNLIGLIPATENMVSGSGYRVDDIVTSLSGQTIEVLNTDAEGRLILCDALTYAERFEPEIVIDIATLTGACIVALGRQLAGLFTNDEPLAEQLLAAGETSGDKLWQLPLVEEYQELLNSPVADMSNVGGPDAGAITAACFLSRFTKKYRWAHLDIAGIACKSTGKDRMASGRPIPALVEFLRQRAAAAISSKS